jgi:glutathione synthase/RimK-type ligase-like ATP-grasp enzyme
MAQGRAPDLPQVRRREGFRVTHVLLLGAGGAAANSVARCLRMAGGYRITGTNADPYDLHLAQVDAGRLLPRADDPGYGEALHNLIEELHPDVILAQPEEEVRKLAEWELSDHLPDFESIEVCGDKFACYEAWREAGLTVPRTVLLRDPVDAIGALETMGRVWLRSVHGAGGSGALSTSSLAEALSWIDRHKGWGTFTAAEVLSAETVAWQSVWHHGRLVAGQSKRRLRWANAKNVPSGIGGSAAISETVSDPAVSDAAIAAIATIDTEPHGAWGVDFAYDKHGVLNPTEINLGRFFTTVDFFAAAGLNLPDLLCNPSEGAALHDPLPPGLLWIRGMDRAPKLVRTDVISDAASMAWEMVA